MVILAFFVDLDPQTKIWFEEIKPSCKFDENNSEFVKTRFVKPYDELKDVRLTSTKRFTDLNLDVIVIERGFHISYEYEYFYQCIITFWCLRDSRGPI